MITIVFGKPGCGKTAYMTADAVRYMNNSAECLELQRVSSKHVAELKPNIHCRRGNCALSGVTT